MIFTASSAASRADQILPLIAERAVWIFHKPGLPRKLLLSSPHPAAQFESKKNTDYTTVEYNATGTIRDFMDGMIMCVVFWTCRCERVLVFVYRIYSETSLQPHRQIKVQRVDTAPSMGIPYSCVWILVQYAP